MKVDHEGLLAAKLSAHSPLTGEDQAALSALLTRPQRLRAGENLAEKGDHLDVATLVVDGMLARTKLLRDGRRQILSLLLPGDLIDAYASLLRKRDDNLEALCATTVVVVPQSRLLTLDAQHPRLREAFLREAFIEGAVVREWVLNIGRRNAREALAHLLCELHQRYRIVNLEPETRFPLPLKQQDLADALGLSAIHLNRVLRELRAEGLIVVSGKALEILDLARLRTTAHFDGEYLHLPEARAA